ncbi:hypothetical protein N499_0500, partial [Wolbachia pipientis wVitA]
MHNHITNFYWE